VLIDPAATWADPASVATHVVVAEPAAVCASLAMRLGARRACAASPPRGDGWLARWRAAGARTRKAITASLRVAQPSCDEGPSGRGRAPVDRSLADDAPFEGDAVAALAHALPAAALLYVGNSLAIRALDAFWPAEAAAPRVLVNRGANGIDGFVSSVLGAAAADPSVPVVGLCGDLSFYHDLNGLLAARRAALAATFVVLDNDGGGIFDHLPIAAHRDGYEQLFATPHGLDFRGAVEMFGCAFVRVASAAELAAALERASAARGTTVIVLRIDRARSLQRWGAIRAHAVAEVAAWAAGGGAAATPDADA
jgi:2-succinyl-5-enolpyruvyl-6-hydroxy-3-cyclohexene-1-carboxylate synthase